MPSNGGASASGKSKAEENFYLSEGKKNKNRSRLTCLLPLALAKAARSVVFQTLILIGTKCLKMPLSQTFKLQTSKTGFKSKTHSHLTNDGLC
jgi:hypothetical protein